MNKENSIKELRRKVLLPVFQLSELCAPDDPCALKRAIKQGIGREALSYYYRFVVDEHSGVGYNYNLFPVVLDRVGAPWSLGTLFILSQLEGKSRPNMTSFQSRADDLGAYKEWLDQHDRPDEMTFSFPKVKLRRPTYRYQGHLRQQIAAQEISPSTGKRRMGSVIAFYRWLVENQFFEPEHPLWEEKQYQLFFKNTQGFSISKHVTTTDVSIKSPKANDPFEGTIQDGGSLRPLTGEEQRWVLEAAEAKSNTEAYLLQLFMLCTGARIQTACTLRVQHVTQDNPKFSKALSGGGEVFKLKAGPGTGIDTKNDKAGVLQIPRPIYETLRTYALSARAMKRRQRTKGGSHPGQYLFLTQQGSPYYEAKADATRFDPDLTIRHQKTGQTLRQFLKEHAIPFIQKRHNPHFHYHVHDLRASFGMNMVEAQSALVQNSTITLHKARMNVKDMMWHESFATTDLYLNYRSQMDATYAAINDFGEQLLRWTAEAMTGDVLNG